MKKQKTLILFATIFIAINFMSCTKDETPAPPSSKTTLVSGTLWKFGSFKIDFGTGEQDMLSLMPACQKDDLHSFATTGKYWQLEGATKCDVLDPDSTDNGSWSLNADKTRFIMVDGTDTTDLKIDELTSTSFRLSGMVDFSGNPGTAKIWFVK